MSFTVPQYTPPSFRYPPLNAAPRVRVVEAPADGIAPANYHGTSNHPEYLHLGDKRWVLAPESRMDSVLVVRGETVEVVEPRRLKRGDRVVTGRTENGEEGIFVHTDGFCMGTARSADKFTFRTRGTRETPFSRSYDALYELLRHDRDHGHIVWVLGPAVAFDKDSRDAMQAIIEAGFCHALLAGNALATHDLEAAHLRTGLGQDIYTQMPMPMGHYNHLDMLNTVRRIGSIRQTIEELHLQDGIMYACEKHSVPYVLAGSIRDDGPLPEVVANVYEAQEAMRVHARRATTVIAMATQLHSIAFGNMTPSYRVMDDGGVRPVYFYVIDISEFSVDKLANRGSAQATAIVTNVQDFVVNLCQNIVGPGAQCGRVRSHESEPATTGRHP
jgi:lysine-ketoglutarate reductase/saccharopine dehydrogenase-like protein (TIGR00300 family)